MHETNLETTPKRYLCRHIFTQGHRCGSPALRGELFCYYHHTTRKPISNQALADRAREGSDATFILATPDDRHALHLALTEILQRVAEKRIDPKRAKLLLYGLQIARANLPKEKPGSSPQPLVEEVTRDLTYGRIAPQLELQEAAPVQNTEPTLEETPSTILTELNAVAQTASGCPIHAASCMSGHSRSEPHSSPSARPSPVAVERMVPTRMRVRPAA